MRIALFATALASFALVDAVTIQKRMEFPTADYEEINLAELDTVFSPEPLDDSAVPVLASYFPEIEADSDAEADDDEFERDVMTTNVEIQAPSGDDPSSMKKAMAYALERAT